jgi:hypothetical protein
MPDWRTAPNQGAWRVEMADHLGCRLTIRSTAKDIYHAYINGRSLGQWPSKDKAMMAAYEAALHNPRRLGLRSQTTEKPKTKETT